MSKENKIPSESLWLLFFFILGTALSISLACLYISLRAEGLFVSWELLPSSVRFEHILDANSQSIWVKAANEKFYSWNSNCYRDANSCNQWIEATEIPGDIHNVPEEPMIKNDFCSIRDFRFFRNPSGNLVECAQTQFLGFDSVTIVYYALLDNGTIWAWEYTGSMIENFYAYLCITPFGLVFGILFSAIYYRFERKNYFRRNSNEQYEANDENVSSPDLDGSSN